MIFFDKCPPLTVLVDWSGLLLNLCQSVPMITMLPFFRLEEIHVYHGLLLLYKLVITLNNFVLRLALTFQAERSIPKRGHLRFELYSALAECLVSGEEYWFYFHGVEDYNNFEFKYETRRASLRPVEWQVNAGLPAENQNNSVGYQNSKWSADQ
jgi:hypothetical protein